MMTASLELSKLLSNVSSVSGVSIGRVSDKATWRIDYNGTETQADMDVVAAVIAAFNPDAPTADDVRAEAQRRIMLLAGAASLDACLIKQLNASMRATELVDIKASGGTLTPEQQAEATALHAFADAIKAIRAASNAMEASPPVDYASDARWP